MKIKMNPLTLGVIVFYLIALVLFLGFSHAGTQQVTFAWEQLITPDFGGWRIYSATTAGGPYTQVGGDIPYVSRQATYTHQAQIVLPDNAETTLYFVVRAFDTNGNVSAPSNEVSKTFDFLPPPAPGKPQHYPGHNGHNVMTDDITALGRLIKENARDMKKLAEKLETLEPGKTVFIGSIAYEVQKDRSLKRISPKPQQVSRRHGDRFRPTTEKK